MNAMLSGLKAAEVAESPAIRYCGHMLALAGADVTRYETPTRASTHLDVYLDHAKTLRVDAPTSALDSHDLLIADPGFAWQDIAVPAVTGTVDGFAPGGPRASWAAPEIVLASVGGATNYTHTPDDKPVYGFGHRFEFLAGETLFIVLTSMLGREEPPASPPRVRVCAAEVVASLLPYATTQYAYNNTTSTVEQSGPRYLVECTDGFLCVYAGGAWQNLAALLGDAVQPDDARFVEFGQRFAHVDEFDALVQKWAGHHTVAQAVAAADRCSVAVAPCYTLDDVLADETLAANGLLQHTEVDGRPALLPGLPMRERTP